MVEVVRSEVVVSAKFECGECDVLGDAYGFSRPRTLLEPRCRACVIRELARLEDVNQVILDGPYVRIYSTDKLSRLAKGIESAGELLEDMPKERRKILEDLLNYLREHPHDLSIIDEIPPEEVEIKSALREAIEPLGLTEDYHGAFNLSIKPFFVQGVWRIPTDLRLVDVYELEEGRGHARICQRPDGEMFYELGLPEFRLDPRKVVLLHSVFGRAQGSGRPSEALYYELMKTSAEGIADGELRYLARLLDGWVRWGVLEPLSKDSRLTSIRVPEPPDLVPVDVDHERYGMCSTGIYLSSTDLIAFAEKLAAGDGRTFDEYHPHLETKIPKLGLRFSASRYPKIGTRSVRIEAHRG